MIPISLSANSQLLSSTSSSFKINSKKLTLLYIGSFAKSRRLEILVDVALELVKSGYKEIRFNLIGFKNQKELAYWNKLLEDKDVSYFFNLNLKIPRENLFSHFECRYWYLSITNRITLLCQLPNKNLRVFVIWPTYNLQ